jgi:hypothetical protein
MQLQIKAINYKVSFLATKMARLDFSELHDAQQQIPEDVPNNPSI